MGRHQNHQRRNQADQIVVILVLGLVEQEEVGVAHGEERDAEPERAEDVEVEVHPAARPWLDPAEAQVFEEKGRLDEVAIDLAAAEEPPGLPDHHRSEAEAEGDQRGDVDGRREAIGQGA